MSASRRPVPRIALSLDEAAASLGVSRSHFYERIYPDLRVVYSGRKRLVPVGELERWATENAVRPLERPPVGSRP